MTTTTHDLPETFGLGKLVGHPAGPDTLSELFKWERYHGLPSYRGPGGCKYVRRSEFLDWRTNGGGKALPGSTAEFKALCDLFDKTSPEVCEKFLAHMNARVLEDEED